jgi:hypothetical protein
VLERVFRVHAVYLVVPPFRFGMSLGNVCHFIKQLLCVKSEQDQEVKAQAVAKA